MRRQKSLAARNALFASSVTLIFGALVVSGLAYRAAQAERPDPNAAVAVATADKASAAATALNAHLVGVGDLLQSLAKRGGVRAGGGRAMRTASRAFRRIRGLEQLAAYGVDGKTRWVTRPAGRGRVHFPKETAFVSAHAENAAQPLRLGTPIAVGTRGGTWTPVTLIVEGKRRRDSGVIVAFIRSETLQPFLAEAGAVAALYTDSGVLAGAEPPQHAPLGASFASAPDYKIIEDGQLPKGAFFGAAGVGPSAANVVGFSKLDCCGAVVTSISPAIERPDIGPVPESRWLTLAAAGLMILTALVTIARWAFQAAPDPWRDFGEGGLQTVS